MKKLSLILAAAAMLLMTACTKEQTPTLDGTSWSAKDIRGDRQTTYNLNISNGKGSLSVNDRVTGVYSDNLRYEVMSYTFTDETHGTMKFKVLNYGNPNPGYRYGDTSTHDFDLRVNGTKMGFGNPYRSTILDRTR